MELADRTSILRFFTGGFLCGSLLRRPHFWVDMWLDLSILLLPSDVRHLFSVSAFYAFAPDHSLSFSKWKYVCHSPDVLITPRLSYIFNWADN